MKIALVEDNKEQAKQIHSLLLRAEKELSLPFEVDVFSDGFDFFEKENAQYDLLISDIDMPKSNGMEIAKKIRQKDSCLQIIFITALYSYARDGYEVDAVDYILKPCAYETLLFALKEAIKRVTDIKGKVISLHTNEGYRKFRVDSIYYIMMKKHRVNYFTDEGIYSEFGTIKKVEAELSQCGFIRCNNDILVNVNKITKVGLNYVEVNSVQLPISRSKKKSFLDAFTIYFKRR